MAIFGMITLLQLQGFRPLSPLPIKNGMWNVVGSTET